MLSPKIILSSIALTISTSLAAQEIKIASGERWYGIESNTLVEIDSQNTQGDPQFLISNKGRYIHSQEPFEATIGSNKITLSNQVKVQNGGKTLREAFLYCYHRNFRDHKTQIATQLYTAPIYDLRGSREYLSIDGDLVSVAEGIINENWPVGTILLGDDWQTSLGSYTLDSEYYVDMKAQIQTLHDKGFKVILSVTPYISASGRIFNTYKNKQLLIEDSNTGSAKIIALDGYGHAAIYDIDAEGAKENLIENIKNLVENYNIDGIFTDGSMASMLMNHDQEEDFIETWNSLCDIIPLELNIKASQAEHYTPSISTYSYNKISDNNNFLSDYLSQKFMFTPFNSQALHCGEGLADLSLAAKYLQHTALMPMCLVPFLPYQIQDAKLKADCKSIIDIRTKLSSYILASIEESLLTGEPIMRSLEYMFPRQGFFDCLDQYMLGNRYMIVPASKDSKSRTVRLPKGTWYSSSGERIKGPVVRKIDIKDSEILYFSNEK